LFQSTLTAPFIHQQRGRHGDVQRLDRRGHRDGHVRVSHEQYIMRQPSAFSSNQKRNSLSQVDPLEIDASNGDGRVQA
jgi:hypothetical protein